MIGNCYICGRKPSDVDYLSGGYTVYSKNEKKEVCWSGLFCEKCAKSAVRRDTVPYFALIVLLISILGFATSTPADMDTRDGRILNKAHLFIYWSGFVSMLRILNWWLSDIDERNEIGTARKLVSDAQKAYDKSGGSDKECPENGDKVEMVKHYY